MNNNEYLKNQFKTPDKKWRSIPFWAWNDELHPEEIKRQIYEMSDQGMGGFFMHSREGLESEYMGKRWMECVDAAIKAAKDKDMKAWLYDEDRWPSGTAGGAVTASGDEYCAQGMTIEVVINPDIKSVETIDENEIYAVFLALIDSKDKMKLNDCKMIDFKGYKEGNVDFEVTQNAGDKALLILREEVAQKCEWFNDQAPPNNLNPDTVKLFIEKTHEEYKKVAGEEFGSVVPGIFTDEPGIHDRNCKFTAGRGWIPWTKGFQEFFESMRGYSMDEFIPHIFFNTQESAFIRHDYWRTVSELFSQSYTKQISDWCKNNSLQFTGHFLWENAMGVATRVCGAIMPNYRYMDIPGIDMLCEQTDEVITAKQCTSVANQLGMNEVITETYGCTGWDFTFEGQKWIGDFQYVMGVNLRSQHLALYSLKGCRKRDYPPVFSYNTTWWKNNNVVEEYFARISEIMSQGTSQRDVLIIHPASTAWSRMGSNPYYLERRGGDRDIAPINEYGDEFNEIIKYMLDIHYDYDLGDETIITDFGSIEDGQFRIENAKYKVVIIPPVDTLLKNTIKLINEFLSCGGRVIIMRPIPMLVEGRKSKDIESIVSNTNCLVVDSKEDLADELPKMLDRNISIADMNGNEEADVFYLLKKYENYRYLFIVNNNRHMANEVIITFNETGSIEEWDALTGKINNVDVKISEGVINIKTKLEPADSKIYVVNTDSNIEVCETNIAAEYEKVAELANPDSFEASMENSYVLDKCSYKIEDGDWSEVKDVWMCQREIREKLSMRQIYYNGLVQRYRWINEEHPSNGTNITLKFNFNVNMKDPIDLYLILEEAKSFNISLNGKNEGNEPNGYFLDKSFSRVKLSNIKAGKNELALECEYQNWMEIEDCYLVGDFGVNESLNIIDIPGEIKLGDWCNQGYKFYIGNIKYKYEMVLDKLDSTEYILSLGEYSATNVIVNINCKKAGNIPWASTNNLDISQYIIAGKNLIEIEVVSSPRNMLGPFHTLQEVGDTTDWSSFRIEDGDLVDKYVTRPYGLMEPIGIIKRV